MRTFTPIVINNNKGLKYTLLTIDKAIIFGERNNKKEIFFETESFGIIEQLTTEQLKKLTL